MSTHGIFSLFKTALNALEYPPHSASFSTTECAVPFFNSDNCHGDDFHYTTIERIRSAFDFWEEAYENGWFVRLSIVDKSAGEVVGTIEEFHRDASDHFDDCGLLRLDLRSDHEKADSIESIRSLIVRPPFGFRFIRSPLSDRRNSP